MTLEQLIAVCRDQEQKELNGSVSRMRKISAVAVLPFLAELLERRRAERAAAALRQLPDVRQAFHRLARAARGLTEDACGDIAALRANGWTVTIMFGEDGHTATIRIATPGTK